MAGMAVYALTGKWDRQAGFQAARSSSASGMTPLAASCHATAATASHGLDATLSSCVTPCARRVFDLLGFQSSTVVWMGGVLGFDTSVPELQTTLVDIFMVLSSQQLQRQVQVMTGSIPSTLLSPDATATQLQIQTLLPSLLYHWVSHRMQLQPVPARGGLTTPDDVLWCVSHAASAGFTYLEQWSQQATAQQQQPQAGRRVAADADSWLLLLKGQIPPLMVAELLPPVLRALNLVLKHPEKEIGHLTTAVRCLFTLGVLLRYSQVPAAGMSAAASASVAAAAAASLQVAQDSLGGILATAEAAVRYLALDGAQEYVASSRVSMHMRTAVRDLLLFLTNAVLASESGLHIMQQPSSMHKATTQLQELYSLLSSVLRANSVCLPPTMFAKTCTAVAAAAVAVVRGWTQLEAGSSSSGSYSVSSVLPSLVLVGRCCLQLSQARNEALAAASAPQARAMLQKCVQVCIDWLSLPSVSQQLAVLGYQPQMLLTAAQGSGSSSSKPPTLAQLAAVGQLCCDAFPIADCCNNPGCRNVAGPSDMQLVLGRTCKCGACRIAHYCCRACQRVHWKAGHKPVCQALAAAAAAAKAAAAAAASTPDSPFVDCVARA